MCGRFAFYSPREAVSDLFDVEFPLALEPRFNIAPTQYVVTLRQSKDVSDNYSAEPALLRWGLVPSWARDPRIGNRMINARSETVDKKPAYRAAFKRRRCVILADGFYEWRRTDDGKTPFYISGKNQEPFAMAGLWERWGGEESIVETCTIITTVANRSISSLHDRMPVILTAAKMRKWIDPATDSRETLLRLLAPADEDFLQFWEVSRSVNNARNEGADLIEPL